MTYLARLKAKIGEKQLLHELPKLTEAPFVSFVSSQGEGFCRIAPGETGLPESIPDAIGERAHATDHAVIIDITEHFARAQRTADRKNADAAQRGHTDRWCKCGDYAPSARRIAGREIWLCPACEKDRV